nr:MAG TPA: hypothetical protein [Caudoviricetes sp.]
MCLSRGVGVVLPLKISTAIPCLASGRMSRCRLRCLRRLRLLSRLVLGQCRSLCLLPFIGGMSQSM